MTRLFTDGAECASALAIPILAGNWGVSTVQKRSGAYSYNYSAGTNAGSYGLGIPVLDLSEVYLRCGMFLGGSSVDQNGAIWTAKGSSTPVLSVRINNSTGEISVYGTELLATGTIQVAGFTWFLLEVYFKMADVGQIIVKVNGVVVINYSSDTKPSTDSVFDRVYFGVVRTFAANDAEYIDDIAVNDTDGVVDNSWCGDGHVIALTPDAAGAINDFTPTSGSPINNYTMVDEVSHDSDTSYVESATPGAQDLYNMSACELDSETQEIARLWISSIAKDTTTGSGIVKLLVSSGSTITKSAEIALATSYALYNGEELLVNPETSLPWTPTELDALQAGIEVVT